MGRKKILFIITGWAIAILFLASCKQTGQTSQSEGKVNDNVTEDSLSDDDSGHYIEIGTLSDRNLWLKVNPSSLHSSQSKRLADAYNASVVMNSLMTDFDLQMRLGFENDNVIEAIKGIDLSIVNDEKVLAKLKAYKKEMLYLLSVDPDSVDQKKHNPWKAKDDLYAYLSKRFHVHTFGKLNEDLYWKEYNHCPSVPKWEQLREKRGDGSMVKELENKYNTAKDFDARCIYAIELAHAYEDNYDSWHDDGYNPAIPIMESLMKERHYSLYLNELWQKWRVLYQDSKGASKDSEIPNWIYNDYRNICCCTILTYIESHPTDIKAINEFVVMACKENILREGEFDYGNQAAVEKYYLFPEKYAKQEKE